MKDLAIINANELLTLRKSSNRPRIGEEMRDLNLIQDGAVIIKGGRIVEVGKTKEVKRHITEGTKVIDATEKVVMPGFIDAHTHVVFAGSREDEFEKKIEGKTYLEFLKESGGILSTVEATRKATKDELVKNAKKTLDSMLKFGTTTIETKSGYGLDLVNERKCLEVVKKLNKEHCVDVIPTFLGAHAIPMEFNNCKKKYVNLIINKMLPEITKRKLAEYCDVFCQPEIFSLEDTRRILQKAKSLGMKLKIHADELSYSGGVELAADLGVTSADHLEYISDNGIRRMREKNVMGVLLPGVPFHLMTNKYAPATKMIRNEVAIAIATDFNPGSCPSESMQMMIALACRYMKVTPAEAITASTINAAHSVDRAHDLGSLDVGKKADLIILDIPNHKHIPYHFGINLVESVIKNGLVVI